MQRVLLLDGATLNLAGELPGSADVKEVLSLVASDGATTQMRAIDVFPDPHGGLRFSVFFYLGDFIISRSVKQLSIVICDSQNQEIPPDQSVGDRFSQFSQNQSDSSTLFHWLPTHLQD